MPKAVEKDPVIPTLSKLAHVHTRISKGFAPYAAINEKQELEGMEEHRMDLMTIAEDNIDAMSPATISSAASMKKDNEITGENVSDVSAAFTPTRKTRYSSSTATASSSTANKPKKVTPGGTKTTTAAAAASKKGSNKGAPKTTVPPSKIVKSRQTVMKKKEDAYMGHTVQYKQKVCYFCVSLSFALLLKLYPGHIYICIYIYISRFSSRTSL